MTPCGHEYRPACENHDRFVKPALEALGVRIKVLCVVCCILALASFIEGIVLWQLL